MAVALDTSTISTKTSTTTNTIAHTCTGSNLVLVVIAACDSGDLITGATYNTVAMSLAVKKTQGTSYTTYMFYMINPPTGAHNVVITQSGTGGIQTSNISYTGANQSSFPDSFSSNGATTATITASTTVVASGCWVILGSSNAAGDVSAGTNCTLRQHNGALAIASADSNGILAAGNQTITETILGGSALWSAVIASIAPAGAAPTANSGFFFAADK